MVGALEAIYNRMPEDKDFINKLKDLLGSANKDLLSSEYPKEALPKGTFVRPERFNRLGVVIDAFYGELDADNKKIIVYTVLLFPGASQRTPYSTSPKGREQYYLTNEYEYEVIAYLMKKPLDISGILEDLEGYFY